MGLSDLRTVFKVTIAAEGDRGDTARRALRMSYFDSGEPVIVVRPGRAVMLPELRTRATAV